MTEVHPFSSSKYEISWSSLAIAGLKETITSALQEAESHIQEIEALSIESVSYATVAEALESCSDELDLIWSIVEHLNNVMDSPELRSAYSEVLPMVTEFYSGICLRPKLWKVVKLLGDKSDENGELNSIHLRHMEELVKDFEECGADLEESKRKRISEIDNELAKITQKYSENVLDSTNAWELVVDDPSVVKDFPEVLREIARENALQKGYGSADAPQWRFTLHAPSFGPFLKFVNDTSLRKKAWEAATQIGRGEKWDNGPLICQILKLRQEKAEILGFSNFADNVLQRRMARNGETARDFVKRMKDAVGLSVPKDVAELEEFRAEELGLAKAESLEPWDVAYWSEKLLKARYDFDDEWLRPFFPINRVLEGMFDLVEKIFGLRVVEKTVHVGKEGSSDSVEVWTDNVQFYEICDRDSGHKMGAFYADWFPRESKRSGAWMDTLRSGKFGENGTPDELPLGIMCGNMTPGSNGKPALLTHSEVETVFHEFGHLIHEICGEIL